MLTVLCDGKSIDFDLVEMSAADCREESQSLLFSVWDSLETTKAKLTKAGQFAIKYVLCYLCSLHFGI